MPLDISAEISKLRQLYKEDEKQTSSNILLLGELGSGKTTIARTARLPVHIDSFDPGGTKGLRQPDVIVNGKTVRMPSIETGEIIADTRWEQEDPKKPTAYGEWRRAFDVRAREGYFEHFGTYILDSSTMWSEAIMNDILRAAGIPGEAPRFTKDYGPQKNEIRNYVRKMLNLPCDFILTGHLKAITDEGTGQTIFRFMTTGQGMIIIPTMFDEVWIADPKKVSSGIEYRVLLQSTGQHLARSRLAATGRLSIYEPADLRHIFKKAGVPCEDKPLLGVSND